VKYLLHTYEQSEALRGGSDTRVLSRNEKDLRKKFPEVKDSIAVIDGEIVALDEKGRSSFQALQGFDMGRERPPIVSTRSICCSRQKRNRHLRDFRNYCA
jgi:hypothetical protein